jgi:hypothetical protein
MLVPFFLSLIFRRLSRGKQSRLDVCCVLLLSCRNEPSVALLSTIRSAKRGNSIALPTGQHQLVEMHARVEVTEQQSWVKVRCVVTPIASLQRAQASLLWTLIEVFFWMHPYASMNEFENRTIARGYDLTILRRKKLNVRANCSFLRAIVISVDQNILMALH